MSIAPYNDVFDVCAVCITPMHLNGLLRHILTGYFSDSDNIKTNQLKQYIYSDNPTETRIRIEISDKFDYRLADRYPSIIIKRIKWQGSSAHATDRSGSIARMWDCDYAILCASHVAVECDLLASEVSTLLWAYKTRLLRYTRALDITIVNLDPAAENLRVSDVPLFVNAVGLRFSFADVADIYTSNKSRLSLVLSIR